MMLPATGPIHATGWTCRRRRRVLGIPRESAGRRRLWSRHESRVLTASAAAPMAMPSGADAGPNTTRETETPTSPAAIPTRAAWTPRHPVDVPPTDGPRVT